MDSGTTVTAPTITGTTTLDARNLAVSFKVEGGKVDAVRGVSFALRKGETIGIVGESGSGKSVTARAIMRLLTKRATIGADSRILLDGVDIVKLPERDMRKLRGAKISMIFQEPMSSLNPVYTIGAQIREVLHLHNRISRAEAEKRAIGLLEEVQIPDPEARMRQYPHQLSGGQRQRVMIAIALANRPGYSDRGRTHHRPRRDRAGADPEPDQGSEDPLRHGGDPHHPRPDRRPPLCRPRLCYAAWRGEGAQHGGRAVRRPETSLHAASAVVGPQGHRQAAGRGHGDDPRGQGLPRCVPAPQGRHFQPAALRPRRCRQSRYGPQARRDPGAGGRIRFGQDHLRPSLDRPAEDAGGRSHLRRCPHRRRSTGSRCARSERACRSSSRTRSPHSTRA